MGLSLERDNPHMRRGADNCRCNAASFHLPGPNTRAQVEREKWASIDITELSERPTPDQAITKGPYPSGVARFIRFSKSEDLA